MPPFLLPIAAAGTVDHRLSSALIEGFSQWWQMPVFVAGLAAVAAWVAWMYRRDAVELPRGVGAVLALLRLGALAALAVAALDLERIEEHEVVFPSRVAVLVDSSASMTLPEGLAATAAEPQADGDAPATAPAGSRAAKVLELLGGGGLLAALAPRHEVAVWRFDADAESLAVLPREGAATTSAPGADTTSAPGFETATASDAWREELRPSGFETRIGEALAAVLDQEPAGSLAGVVVLTDGGNNAGVDPAAVATTLASSAVPVFAIGAGSDRLPTNVRVADLLVPARVYPGDRFAVQGHLQAQGLEGQVVKVELVEMPLAGAKDAAGAEGAAVTGPRVIDAAEVALAADGGLAAVRFEVPGIDAPGRHDLAIRVVPPPADRTPGDDAQVAEVEVVDRVTQVLLMASGPTREYQFMRNVLERDESFAVDVLLGTATRGASQDARRILDVFPATSEELSAYDCIVAFDVDWRSLDAAAQARLERWVARESGGLVLVAGHVFMDAWLADPQTTVIRGLHPVELRRSGQVPGDEPAGFEEPMALEFTRDGLDAEFLWLAGSRIANQTVWGEFPGFYSCFEAAAAKPGATVYARVVPPGAAALAGGAEGRGAVALAGQFYGSGTAFYVGSGETWRLRALDDAFFERLATQLVRHVSQGRLLAGSRRARLLLERDRQPVGATIAVRLVAADGDAASLAGATLRVEAPDGSKSRVALVPDAGRPDMLQGAFVASREGRWRIDAELGDGSGETLSRAIQARLPDRELERPRLDRGLLERLGTLTGGGSHFLADGPWGPEQSAALAARLPDRSRREYESGAPDAGFKRRLNGLLLAVATGLLCLEWILRRLVKLA